MHQTTYMMEFQPPHLREENFICRKQIKLGKKHFPELAAVKELGSRLTYVEHGPALIDACQCDTESKDQHEDGDSETDGDGDAADSGTGQRRRCSAKLPEFLYHMEWTPLNVMGHTITPRLIPTKLTPEQEKLLLRMMEETEDICMPTDEAAAGVVDKQSVTESENALKVIETFTPQPIYKKYEPDECRLYCRGN